MANMKSRVKREFHARFCESLLVKFLWATRLRGERKSPLLDLMSLDCSLPSEEGKEQKTTRYAGASKKKTAKL